MSKEKASLKLAQFKSIEHGFISIHDWDDDFLPDEYIRVSEYVKAEFVPINSQELVAAEVAIIESKIHDVNAEAGIKINILESRKAELLALPNNQGESKIRDIEFSKELLSDE